MNAIVRSNNPPPIPRTKWLKTTLERDDSAQLPSGDAEKDENDGPTQQENPEEAP